MARRVTKRERYRIALRRIVNGCLDLQEDITARSEKMFLGELIREIKSDIKLDERFGINPKRNRMMLRVASDRLGVL